MVAMRLIQAKDKGNKLIVVDPRKTHIAADGRHPRPAPARDGCGPAQRHDARHLQERLAQQAFCRGAHREFRCSDRNDRAVSSRKGRRDHRRGRIDHHQGGGALRQVRNELHHLLPGHHPALDGGGQCKEPGQSGHALRPDREAVHGREPAARPEQRPGRLRHGGTAQRLSRLPGGDRSRKPGRNSKPPGEGKCPPRSA